MAERKPLEANAPAEADVVVLRVTPASRTEARDGRGRRGAVVRCLAAARAQRQAGGDATDAGWDLLRLVAPFIDARYGSVPQNLQEFRIVFSGGNIYGTRAAKRWGHLIGATPEKRLHKVGS